MGSVRSSWLLPAVMFATGCQAVFGLGDYELGTASGGTGSGGLGGSGAGGSSALGGGDGGGGMPPWMGDCCVDPEPPLGWTYAGVIATTPQSALDVCPEGDDPIYFRDGLPPQHTCSSTCACNPPTGVSCSSQLQCFSDNSCINAVSVSNPILDCIDVPGNADYCRAVATVTSQGSCTPTDAEPVLSTESWSVTINACEVGFGAACAGDQVCAETSGAALCVWKDGDFDCPTTFDERSVYFTGENDTRSCSACDCMPADGATCGPMGYEKVTLNACVGFGPTIMSGTCTNTNDAESFRQKNDGTMTPGSCQPSGGEPVGAFTPQGAVTVCCRPSL